MSLLAFCTLSSLATRKRSKDGVIIQVPGPPFIRQAQVGFLLSSSRSSCILLVLGSGLLASTCQRWLTAAAGFAAGVDACRCRRASSQGDARFRFCIYARRSHQTIADTCPDTDGTTTAAKADKFCCLLLVSYRPLAVCAGETARLRLPDGCFFGAPPARTPTIPRAAAREAAPGLLLCAHCGAETEGQRALQVALSLHVIGPARACCEEPARQPFHPG